MRTMLLALFATGCLVGTGATAATEPRVSRSSILSFEGAINDRFRTNTPDPWELIGTARGTFLDGYGVVFTIELQLVNVAPPNPFRQTISPAEIASIHDRKMKKLPLLRESMRGLIASASSSLPGLQPGDHIAMETIVWTYSWENAKGIPHRIFMSGERQRLMDAQATRTDLATVIEEQER